MRYLYVFMLVVLMCTGVSCSDNTKNTVDSATNQNITNKDLYKISLESKLDFGVVDELHDSSKKVKMTISNEGIFAVPINMPSLTNQDFKFSSTDNFNNPLQPGERFSIDIEYIPTSIGNKKEVLNMSDFIKLPKGSYNEVTTGSGTLYGKDVKEATYLSNQNNKEEFDGKVKITASYVDNRRPELQLEGLTSELDTIGTGVLDFGITKIGESDKKQLKLTNIGNFVINMSSIELVTYNKGFTISKIPSTLKPKESVMVDIDAIINHIGSDHAYLVIKSNDYYHPIITIKLLIQSSSDIITVEPAILDYDKININPATEVVKSIKITNKSAEIYNIESLNTSGDGYSIKNTTCLNILSANNNCSIDILFNPTVSNIYNGFLDIKGTTDTEEHNIKVSLMGEGIDPKLNIVKDFNMGLHTVGDKELVKYIDIKNVGKDLLLISDIYLSNNNDFKTDSSQCMKILNSNETCKLPIYFKPQNYGAVKSILTIKSNDRAESHEVNITGVGTGTYLSTENDIYFGQSENNIVRDITFTNTGYDDIIFNSMNFVFSTNFRIIKNQCSVIKRDESCNITVEFSPAYMQPSSDMLDVYYNGNVRYTINMFGRGVMPVLEVVPNTENINFGNIAINQPMTSILTIKNNGLQIPLELSLFQVTGNKFSIKNNGCTRTINTGETCRIELEASSSDLGSAIGKLSFLSNDPSANQYSVNLLAEFVNSVYTTNTNNIDFGEILVGKEVSQTLSIINTGLAGGINIEKVEVGNPLFVIDNQCIDYETSLLQPGEYCNVIIKMTPIEKGIVTDNVTITTNSSQEPIKQIPVTITGIASEYSLNLQTINFGSLGYNAQGKVKTVTFKNTGSEPINVVSIKPVAPFKVVNNNCVGKQIAANGVCNFGLNIQADRLGNITNNVEVIATSVTEPKKIIELSAKVPRYTRNVAGIVKIKAEPGTYKITLDSGGSGGGGGGGGGYDPAGHWEFPGGSGVAGTKGGASVFNSSNFSFTIQAPNAGGGGAGGGADYAGNGDRGGDASNQCINAPGLSVTSVVDETRTKPGSGGDIGDKDTGTWGHGGGGGISRYCRVLSYFSVSSLETLSITLGNAGTGGNGGGARGGNGTVTGDIPHISGGNGGSIKGNGSNGGCCSGGGGGGAGGYPGAVTIEMPQASN